MDLIYRKVQFKILMTLKSVVLYGFAGINETVQTNLFRFKLEPLSHQRDGWVGELSFFLVVSMFLQCPLKTRLTLS